MMRANACTAAALTLVVALLFQAPAAAQKESAAAMEIELKDFLVPMSFKEFIGLIGDKTAAKKERVLLVVDWRAIREHEPDLFADAEALYNYQIKPLAPQENRDGRLPLTKVLELALAQFPTDLAYLVGPNSIDITHKSRTGRQYLLNQTFFKNFDERPLHQALSELSEMCSVSIVLDARAKDKARTLVSAKFRNDVALQDAVRMLAEMSELKIVHLVTGLFVTTPEQALKMQKELQKLYEPYGPTGAPVAPGFPEISPLTPPLPPPPRSGLPSAA